jgi:UDPglucose 6-dehydrogenase
MAVIRKNVPYTSYVVDLNEERIAAWNDEDVDNIPIYEPGLDVIVGLEEEIYFFYRCGKN